MNLAYCRGSIQNQTADKTLRRLRCCLLSVGRDEFLGDEGFK